MQIDNLTDEIKVIEQNKELTTQKLKGECGDKESLQK
jgi:hypothetical protein